MSGGKSAFCGEKVKNTGENKASFTARHIVKLPIMVTASDHWQLASENGEAVTHDGDSDRHSDPDRDHD